MNVRKLVGRLKNMNQDAIVVMAIDLEGNNFNILYDLDEMKYIGETTTSGQVYEVDENCINEDYEDAVVLWP